MDARKITKPVMRPLFFSKGGSQSEMKTQECLVKLASEVLSKNQSIETPTSDEPVVISGVTLEKLHHPVLLDAVPDVAIRKNIRKLADLLFDQTVLSNHQSDDIFKHLLQRMCETATLLVALEIEDKDCLLNVFQNGNFEKLLGLTFLHIAFDSKNSFSDLVLAGEFMLSKSNCPANFMPMFDYLFALKKSVNNTVTPKRASLTVLGSDEQDMKESTMLCEWMKLVCVCEKLSTGTLRSSDLLKAELVNGVIDKVNEFEQASCANVRINAT